jgi:PHD/YefM family antitoxin component YafN of YafNO toxin-antitoxin module
MARTQGTHAQSVVVERVRGLMHRFIGAAADHLVLAAMRRGNPKAIVLPEDEYEAFVATLEVEEDEEALDDLRAGREETRSELPPAWDEVRDEMGLGARETHAAG